MAKEVITTLHPEDDITTDLYPNIKEDNIPSTFKEKVSSEIANRTELIHKDASSSNTIVVGESDYALELVGTQVNARSKLNCSYITALNGDDLALESKEGVVSVYGDLVVSNNGIFSVDRIEALTGSDINVDAHLLISDGLSTSTGEFNIQVRTDNINNTNGNAMVRYKSTENKVVLGGSTIPTTIMGSGDRPNYSKNGSDFSGNPLALKSDVDTETTERKAQDTTLQSNIDKKANTTDLDTLKSSVNTNWSTLMANLGIGRWANQTFVRDWWGANNIFYDSMLPLYTNVTRTFASIKGFDFSSSKPVYVSHNFNDSISEMRYTFAWGELKNELLLPAVSQAIRVHYCFYGSAFTKIGFKSGVEPWKLKGVISRAFAAMPNLTEIGAFDVSQVTSFDCTFEGCLKLKSIHCTHFKVTFIISPSTAFEEADLVEIISNLDTVTTTQTLTMGATNLAKLTDDEKKVATDKGWVLA